MAQELFSTSLFNDANLKAYYRFNSGALTTDSKGSNTLQNIGTVGELASGLFGVSADLGSSNSSKAFRTPSTDIGIAGSSAFSASIWVKIQTEPGTNATYVLMFHDSTTSDHYIFLEYIDLSGVKKLRVIFSGTTTDYTVTLGTSVWHNIIIVRDISNTKGLLYLDGVAVISNATLGASAGGVNNFDLGYDENSGNWSSIFMDDVAVFNRVLTPTDVAIIYSSAIDYTATYNETITPSDTLIKATSRSFSETISLSETFRKTITRTFTEIAVTMTESFMVISSKALNFLETITMTETLSRTYTRRFSEVISMIESFTKSRQFPVFFNDTITMTDGIWRWLRNTISRFTREETKL